MTPRVSIIVPCHNAAPYLAECLDSLLAQTLREIEILCIDDGSGDETGAILRAYVAKDARVQVIAFSENRGVSCARNAGLRAAHGAYIGFCDADDWVDANMYEALYQAARALHADGALCAVKKHYSAQRIDTVALPWPDGTRFDARGIREELIANMLARETDTDALPVSGYTPRNLFRREALQGHAFREDIHYAEDLLFLVEALLDAQSFAVVGAAMYHYRFTGTSVTKRYSPYVPESHEKCHAALDEAFARAGLDYAARMQIRRRKSAMDAVKNVCLPGTPFAPLARVRRIRAYLRRTDVRTLFAPVKLRRISGTLRLKYAMMKYRQSLMLMFFFSYVFKNR